MKKVFLILCILGIIMPYYQLYFFLVGDNPTFDYFVSEIYSSHPVSMITWDITIAYISFFTYFPDSLNMGIKINWRGQFEGDDDHVANLFIERNIDLVESQKKI